jgi:hypothetical protein
MTVQHYVDGGAAASEVLNKDRGDAGPVDQHGTALPAVNPEPLSKNVL